MKGLALSPAAMTDLEDIWDYSTTHWGLDQADRYTDEIRDACHALADGSKHGSIVNLRPGYLKCIAGSHVIYFLDQGDQLDVIRILHQRQDAE